jgi:hypothetical protein
MYKIANYQTFDNKPFGARMIIIMHSQTILSLSLYLVL